jgi:hypothetical protein
MDPTGNGRIKFVASLFPDAAPHKPSMAYGQTRSHIQRLQCLNLQVLLLKYSERTDMQPDLKLKQSFINTCPLAWDIIIRKYVCSMCCPAYVIIETEFVSCQNHIMILSPLIWATDTLNPTADAVHARVHVNRIL